MKVVNNKINPNGAPVTIGTNNSTTSTDSVSSGGSNCSNLGASSFSGSGVGCSTDASKTNQTALNGLNNVVSGDYAQVLNGLSCNASNDYATVVNGQYNSVTGVSSAVLFGNENNVSGDGSVAGGSFNTITTAYTAAFCMHPSDTWTPTLPFSFTVYAPGGVGIGTPTPNSAFNAAGTCAFGAASIDAGHGTNDTLSLFINVIDTTPAVTFTLYDADCVAGRNYVIKDGSNGATTDPITVAVEGGSSKTIDGVSSRQVTINYGVMRIFAALNSSGVTQWYTW